MSSNPKLLDQFDDVIAVLKKNASKWPETLKELNAVKRRFEAGEMSFADADRVLADYRQYAGAPGKANVSSVAEGMCRKLDDIAQYCRNPLCYTNTTDSDLDSLRDTAHRLSVLSEGLAMGALPSVTEQFKNFRDIARRTTGVNPSDTKLPWKIADCENLFSKLRNQKSQMTQAHPRDKNSPRTLRNVDDLIGILKENPSKWKATLRELGEAKMRLEDGLMSDHDADRVLAEYRPYAADPQKAKASSAAEGICKRLNGIAQLCQNPDVIGDRNPTEKKKFESCARELGVLSEGLANGAFPSVTERFEDFKYLTRFVSDILKVSEQKAHREGKPTNPTHERLHSQIKDCENLFTKLLEQKKSSTTKVAEQREMKATLKEMKEGAPSAKPLKSESGRGGPSM